MRKACDDKLKPEDSTNMTSEEYMIDLTNSKQTNILKLELDTPKTRDKRVGSVKEELELEAAKTTHNQPKFGDKV